MLLTWKDSIRGWANLGWYGHIIVFGGMAFFYVGGAKILRGFHPKGVKLGKGSNGTASGATTPTVEKSGLQIPPPLDEVISPRK